MLVDGGFEFEVLAPGVLGFRLDRGRGKGEKGMYARGDLAATLLVFFFVDFAKDVVFLIFEAGGLVEPLGACIARFGVYMGPDVGMSGDEGVWADSSDGAWLWDY